MDGLLGVGSQLPLRADLADITDWINECSKVIAIDLPTGVSSDTGDVDEHAVHAQLYICFTWIQAIHLFVSIIRIFR